MPLLVAERLGHGLAEHDAASSVVWCWSICRSPLAFSVMSISEWRASCSIMWSRKPTPVAIVVGAGAVEIDGGRNRGLLGAALDRGAARRRFVSLLHGVSLTASLLAIRFRRAYTP